MKTRLNALIAAINSIHIEDVFEVFDSSEDICS